MRYNVKIKLNKKVIFEIELDARNEVEAMEFAYEQLEMQSYAEPTPIDSRKEITE